MCRPRTGPRCSPSGKNRFAKASVHLNSMQEKAERDMQNNGRLTPRRARQLANAHRRMEAAKRVYFGTPAGQKHLQERIDETRATADQFIADGADPRSSLVQNQLAQIANMEEEKALGAERRVNSYADYHMTENERRTIRNESRNRGGMMDKRAHPMTQQAIMDRLLDSSEPARLSLREWTEDDVQRADSWVEAGANPDWVENNDVRPPRVINGVEVGTERVVPSTSRIVRLNTPDGQVVEARYDFHMTKNSAGQYVVSSRANVASSWEDAAPIDVTTQNLGHILSSSSSVTKKEAKSLVGAYSTRAEAETALSEAKTSFEGTYVKATALTGRKSLVQRAHRTDLDLQQRGIVAWFRYQQGDND